MTYAMTFDKATAEQMKKIGMTLAFQTDDKYVFLNSAKLCLSDNDKVDMKKVVFTNKMFI